jgi:drug/metabolite transporter (DMT)-like permease
MDTPRSPFFMHGFTMNKDQPLKGIALITTAFGLFVAMSMFNKLLTGLHHPAEILFYRNLTALIPCLIFIISTHQFHYFHTKHPISMAARVIIGTGGLICTLAATQALPMSTASTLFFVSTIITPILATFILKERPPLHRWVAVAISIIGVIIVAQPSPQVTLIGVALAIAAGTCHSIVHIILRFLKNESALTTTLYFFLGGVLTCGLAMPFIANTPTLYTAFILICIGITGGLGQYVLTRSFALAPASLLNPFAYTKILWSLMFDLTIFNLIPTWTTITGATLIITANLWVIYKERTNK